MIRGVSFKVLPSKRILWKILKCLDIKKYCWYNIVDQCEVWANYSGGICFEKGYYDGKCFLQNIMSDHFVIFLKLQAYKENGNFFELHTYDEFQKSDCQILILINDCEFVEIYVKDIFHAKLIYQNAAKEGFKDIRYITESNDSRTKMDLV